MQVSSTHRSYLRRLWSWPVGIVGLLVMHGAAMGVFVVVATRDASFAVEPQAYAKAVAWNERHAQRQANARLGWSVQVETGNTLDNQGNRLVRVRISAADTAPVSAAHVRLEAFHHARANERYVVSLVPEADGVYSTRLPLRRNGTWEFRIDASRGGTQALNAVVFHELEADS